MPLKLSTIVAVCLSWLCVCAWLSIVCRENGIHPLRSLTKVFAGRPKVERVLFCAFFLAMFLYGSVKPGGNRGAAQPGISGIDPAGPTNAARMLTAEDIEH